MRSDAFLAIERVVREENCSGCGMCAALAENLRMDFDHKGFLRPTRIDDQNPVAGLDREHFNRFCPGVALSPPPSSTHFDDVFGRYESVWEGHAIDSVVRKEGSSGGVITALISWMLETGAADSANGAAHLAGTTRSVPLRLTSREDALKAAGSRYAPVAAASIGTEEDVFVGKPCEVAAACRSSKSEVGGLKLAFFCAGTPSQKATDAIASSAHFDEIKNLRYRGDGWPGSLRIENSDGSSVSMSYEEAWSRHLGPTIQWRCKVCPDGTGEYADIAVGDYWETDDRGFPVFAELPGSSVVVARTRRGHETLLKAVQEGVIAVEPLDIRLVGQVQPSQVLRRRTLGGRLLGALASGRRPPRFRGYGIIGRIVRNPMGTIRTAVGTWRRLRRGKAGEI